MTGQSPELDMDFLAASASLLYMLTVTSFYKRHYNHNISSSLNSFSQTTFLLLHIIFFIIFASFIAIAFFIDVEESYKTFLYYSTITNANIALFILSFQYWPLFIFFIPFSLLTLFLSFTGELTIPLLLTGYLLHALLSIAFCRSTKAIIPYLVEFALVLVAAISSGPRVQVLILVLYLLNFIVPYVFAITFSAVDRLLFGSKDYTTPKDFDKCSDGNIGGLRGMLVLMLTIGLL